MQWLLGLSSSQEVSSTSGSSGAASDVCWDGMDDRASFRWEDAPLLATQIRAEPASSLPVGLRCSTSVRHHHPCATHWAFRLVTACDVSLLLPQTKTCHLLGGASDRSGGSDSAAMGPLP